MILIFLNNSRCTNQIMHVFMFYYVRVCVCVCVPGVSSRSQVVVAFLQTGSAVVLWEHLFALSLSVLLLLG